MIVIFLAALVAQGLYVWLALREVSVPWLVPLCLYWVWAIWWLMRPSFASHDLGTAQLWRVSR